MANVWRKRKGIQYDTWHNCRNCSNWPTSSYDERTTPPTSGEQCDECRSKRANRNCT
jgi:hypothetical protein